MDVKMESRGGYIRDYETELGSMIYKLAKCTKCYLQKLNSREGYTGI